MNIIDPVTLGNATIETFSQ